MVRVRIAPSPTGIPHLGNTRTAIFNWLFARHYHGKFIVRIEDTDQERLVPESVDAIYAILNWLGLDSDEDSRKGGPYGPYVQSQRLGYYQKYAQLLVDKGYAYYCFCSRERLEHLRSQAVKTGKPPQYDRLCSRLSKAEVNKKLTAGISHVIRMKVPNEGKTAWYDLIHGEISFDNCQIDDAVILKSDGFPTYHLAVVVDDYLMRISHVLRGDEWIASTPKHLLLYQFLGFTPPKFGHFPLVLGPDKTKLSKRHGAMSVLEYKEEGYLPEAVINFLALLGWTPPSFSRSVRGEKVEEIFSLKDLVKHFDLDGVNPTSPIFNRQKLDWFNKQWLMRLPDNDLLKRLNDFIPASWDRQLVKQILPLVKERIVTLKDFNNWVDFFFVEPTTINFEKFPTHQVKLVLNNLLEGFERIGQWHLPTVEETARQAIGDEKPRAAFEILRIAITGKTIGPPLFESLVILGKEEVVRRLKNAIGRIK